MTTTALPRWDMTPIFPSLESPEFEAEFSGALGTIPEIATLFDQVGVRRRDDATVASEFVADFENIVGQLNTLMRRLGTLRSYIGCFTTTDANNETAKMRASQMETQSVQLGQLQTRLVAWVGSGRLACTSCSVRNRLKPALALARVANWSLVSRGSRAAATASISRSGRLAWRRRSLAWASSARRSALRRSTLVAYVW